MNHRTNLILNTDSYKLSHDRQYPPGTRRVSSYIESRGGAFDEVLFFGLQAFLKAFLLAPITAADIDEAEAISVAHIGYFNRAGWQHILDKHGGFLPLEICALAEGSVVPNRVPVVQVINTDPGCYWLTGHIETALLRGVWYPSTVASLSRACKKILHGALEQTADTFDALPFMLHDFGARGAASHEAAGLGGAAHLLNFQGTDTLAALTLLHRHYDAPVAGYSIPASEHSTMTAWGRDGETAAYRNMIQQFGGTDKTLAFVVDSYDLWHALDEIVGGSLREAIIASGGRIVIRPDSGDPIAIVPRVVEHLMRHFGHSLNSKGYRVLPPYLRVVQGDGVSLDSLPRILEAMKLRAISADNLAFGMGGGLLQQVNRDTLKWAMKASWVDIDGVGRDICKDPATDPGKRSKAGRYAVIHENGQYQAVREDALAGRENWLKPVFRDGRLLVDEHFEAIRQRANAQFSPAGSISNG